VLLVALVAIYGLVAAGLERNLCFLAATSADGRIHLAGSAAFILAGRTAGRTAFRLVGKTLLLEKLLIPGAEYKRRAAIRTHKRLILKIHYYLFPLRVYYYFCRDSGQINYLLLYNVLSSPCSRKYTKYTGVMIIIDRKWLFNESDWRIIA
jgi:hypothetical protein